MENWIFLISKGDSDIVEFVPGLKVTDINRNDVAFQPERTVKLLEEGRLEEAFKRYYPVPYRGDFPNGKLAINENMLGTKGYLLCEDRADLEFKHGNLENVWVIVDHKYKAVIAVTIRESDIPLDWMAREVARYPKSYGVELAASLEYHHHVYLYEKTNKRFIRYNVGWQLTPEFRKRTPETERKENIRLIQASSPSEGFAVDWDAVYQLASEKFGANNVQVYRDYKAGRYPGGYEEVKKLLTRKDGSIGYKSKGDVTRLFKKIEGYISTLVGESFEVWAQAKIKQLEGVEEVIPDGAAAPKEEADIIALHDDEAISIYSCKLRETSPDSEAISIEIKGAPELQRAKELLLNGETKHLGRKITADPEAPVKVFVLFWNLAWKVGCLKPIPDPFNPPGHILIKKSECRPDIFKLEENV